MKQLFTIIIILILAGFAFVYFSSDNTTPANNTDQPAVDTGTTTPSASGPADDSDSMVDDDTATNIMHVSYTSDGFAPASITIEPGTTVVFDNEISSNRMWVASDIHPTHEEYDGTSLAEHCDNPDATPFDQCEAGTVYEFTFTKEGTYTYHNHARAAHTGTITVEAAQ